MPEKNRLRSETSEGTGRGHSRWLRPGLAELFNKVLDTLQTDLVRKRSRKSGLAPGSLVYTGAQEMAEPRIAIFDYNTENLVECEVAEVEESYAFRDRPAVTWINVDGLHDIDLIEKLGSHYGLHPLVLEDILSVGQRPRMEEYGETIYLVLNMLVLDPDSLRVKAEQISLVLGKNFVVTFQEKKGDVLNPVRDRLRGAKPRLRSNGADYLAYSILDCIVDNYLLLLDELNATFEQLEAELLVSPTPTLFNQLHLAKREMAFLRTQLFPLRELVPGLERCESHLIQEKTIPFLRDLHGHSVEVIEALDTFREMLNGMLDLYLSSLSNRMNKTMQFLTLMATIFIPLSFIAGIYGMNFKNMPELEWEYGYPTVLGAMAVIGIGLALYFHRKKWW